MKHFSRVLRQTTRLALEADVQDGKLFKERERVLYVRLKDHEDLLKAPGIDQQEQWMLRINKCAENQAKGQIRVRKILTIRENGQDVTDPTWQYVLTTKTEVSAEDRREVPEPSSEDMFQLFKQLATNGMIKKRFHFPIEGTELVWEVDAYPKGDSEFHEWFKIDLEMKDTGDELPALPFEVTELIDGRTTDPKERAKISELYDTIFLVSPQQIATEGLIDAFKYVFGTSNREDVNNNWNSSFKKVEDLIDSRSGRLKPGIELKGKDLRFSPLDSVFFTRGRQDYTNASELVLEMSADVAELEKLYRQAKPKMQRSGQAMTAFERDMEAVIRRQGSSNTNVEVVREAILKHAGKLPPAVAASLDLPNRTWLGSTVKPFIENDKFVRGAGSSVTRGDKRITFQALNAEGLEKMFVALEKFSELHREIGSFNTQLSHGLDVTDAPLRSVYDEIKHDREVMNVLRPYLQPTYKENNTQLLEELGQRLQNFVRTLWMIIFASAKIAE